MVTEEMWKLALRVLKIRIAERAKDGFAIDEIADEIYRIFPGMIGASLKKTIKLKS